MMTTNLQNAPYLQRQRDFPSKDIGSLSKQMDITYIDIAQKVNDRTVGIFAVNFPVITGEAWYLQGQPRKQQTLRQVYIITGPGPIITIPHGITLSQIAGFTKIYGTFTDGTNWYPLPYVDVLSATNQVNVIVNPTNIIITRGAGAAPAITKGWVILEWLSSVDTNS
jgi:hypothetical protein